MPRHVYKGFPSKPGTYPNDIRERCLEKGWNCVDLARVMDVAEATAYDIVSGKREPRFTNERKLEMIFGVPITEMYIDPYKGIKLNLESVSGNETK